MTLSDNWQFTPPVIGRLFRLRYLSSNYGRGLIAQTPSFPPLELYSVRRIYGRDTSIYDLAAPACFPLRSIALLQYAGTGWVVEIDVWTGSEESALDRIQDGLERIEIKIDLIDIL